MDRQVFYRESGRALEHIDSTLGDLELEELDVDLAGDVLTLSFTDGGRFIINAHSAAEQIWLAAGTTAWHFDWDDGAGRWIAVKTGDELMQTVATAVGKKVGRPIAL